MTKTPILLDPKILGFWVRCIRETQHMSQDALAESWPQTSRGDWRGRRRLQRARGGWPSFSLFFHRSDPQRPLNVSAVTRRRFPVGESPTRPTARMWKRSYG
jgi:hypothetical protein